MPSRGREVPQKARPDSGRRVAGGLAGRAERGAGDHVLGSSCLAEAGRRPSTARKVADVKARKVRESE